MGAGNPKLKSFDNDRFEPTTYFLDLVGDIDEYKKNTDGASDLDDDSLCEMIAEDSEYNFEDLIESLSSELDLTAIYNTRKSSSNEVYPELSYAFRDDGIILVEGKKTYVITETGSEYSHLPIAVIPNFKYETILEDIEFAMDDKRDWYSARNKDWNAAVEKQANKKWDELMEDFYKEAKTVLSTLYKWYPTSLSIRDGAWMSGRITSEHDIAA